MKTFRFLGIALFAILLCLSACSKGDDDPISPTPKPEVNTPTITLDSSIQASGLSFDTSASEKSISFTTTSDWTLSIAESRSGTEWCKASPTSGGKGTVNVKFTTTENTEPDDRSVAVTIKAGTASKTFTITQKGKDALLVTTKKYELPKEGGEIEIEVKSNVEYQMTVAESAKEWITEATGRALTTHKHILKIAPSEEAVKREGEITFKSGDMIETVKVYQAGEAVLLLSKNEFTVSDAGETISVDIKSNVEYGVQMPDVDWIQAEEASRAMSSHTLKYIVATNETYDNREALIIFYDKNSSLKDTLKITQVQKDAIILSEKEITVNSKGKTIEVKLSSNVDFEVSIPDIDWIKKTDSRALTEQTIYFIVLENTDKEQREAEISFINKNSQLAETLKIIQKKKGNELNLPDGKTFNTIVGNVLSLNNNLKKIKFIANSDQTSDIVLTTDENDLNGYIITNNEWLEIHTSAEEFIANKDCSMMFYGNRGSSPFCKLETIEFGYNFNTSKVSYTTNMFGFCQALTSLDLSKFNTSNVTEMSYMFYYCNALTSLNLSNFNTSKTKLMDNMFGYCKSLTTLDLTTFDTSKVEGMSGMFENCTSLTSLNISSFNTSNVNSMSDMFAGCQSLLSLDLTNFDTSNVTDMEDMFLDCLSLTKLDLSSFDTTNVTTMKHIFWGCIALETLDLSSFNTSAVTNMRGMFYSCKSLKTLDIYHFDTSNVTDMSLMFYLCISFTDINLNNFNTSNVTDMSCMFYSCRALISLDLSAFDTSKVTDMIYMFGDCFALKTLNLSSFEFKNDVIVTDMFGISGPFAPVGPFSIIVSEQGYEYLTTTTTDCGINYNVAKFVKENGEDW